MKKIEGEYHSLHYVILQTALQNARYTKVQDHDDNVFTFQRGKTWIKVSVGAWGDYEHRLGHNENAVVWATRPFKGRGE